MIVLFIIVTLLSFGGLLIVSLSNIDVVSLCNEIITILQMNGLVTFEVLLYALCINLLISYPLSRILSIYNFKFKIIVEFLLLLPLCVPPYILCLIYEQRFSASGIYWTSFILGISTYPHTFILLRTSLNSMSKMTNIFEKMYNLSFFQYFRYIEWNLIKIPLIGGISIAFIEIISEFAVYDIMGVQTIISRIHLLWFVCSDYVLASQLCIIMMIPIILIYIFHTFQSNSYLDNIEVMSPNPITPRMFFVLMLIGSIPLISGVVYPLYILLLWLIHSNVINYSYFWNDLYNSLLITLIPSISSLLLALFVFTTNKQKYLIRLCSIISASMPAIFVGLGMLVISSYINVDGIILIILSYISAYTGYIMITLNGLEIMSLVKLNTIFKNTSLSNKITKIYLPYYWPVIILGSCIVFIETLKSINILLMIQPFGFSTLNLRVYMNYTVSLYEESVLWCLSIIFLTMLVMTISGMVFQIIRKRF